MSLLQSYCSDWLFIFTACFGVIIIAAVGWIAATGQENEKKAGDEHRHPTGKDF